jgi:hypothetical protein
MVRRTCAVHRDEIRPAIWSADTFVHFDVGISFCMQQSLSAVCEDLKKARYIETVPRGYRFITLMQAGRSQQPYYNEFNCSLAVMPFHNLRVQHLNI